MSYSPNQYKKLESLQKSLQLSQEDLCSAVENGFLQVSMKSHSCDKALTHRNHRPLKGFVSICSKDVRAILKHGSIELQKFMAIKRKGSILRLTEEPLKKPISVDKDSLFVLKTHEETFMRAYISGIISKTQNDPRR